MNFDGVRLKNIVWIRKLSCANAIFYKPPKNRKTEASSCEMTSVFPALINSHSRL